MAERMDNENYGRQDLKRSSGIVGGDIAYMKGKDNKLRALGGQLGKMSGGSGGGKGSGNLFGTNVGSEGHESRGATYNKGYTTLSGRAIPDAPPATWING
jgi:hypothetical protein